MAKTYATFLGANTPRGFVSFFDELYNPYESCRPFIIKGGPGTGKSTLMKKIGAICKEKDLDTEWVYCSSDPLSLDGIIIPEKGICVADGTSPHILEPKFPGAAENIINTGDFWDRDMLHKRQDEIRSLTLENSIYHRRSAKYLAAAGSINEETMRLTSKCIDLDKISGFALRFAARELPCKKGAKPGRRQKRFISAITPEGLIFLDGTVKTLATRVIGIDDEYTAASALLAERIGEAAIKNGYDVIFCHCPFKPEQCEHIIIPEMRLALITLKTAHKIETECDRVLHVKRFLREELSSYACTLRFNRRLIKELTAEAIESLVKAKKTHDKLEKLYVDAMDFSALEKHCENLAKSLL
ncbi:MAG: hypothetical protein IJW86_02535 [Clostridia bacterium]|nr:hypothetical protein [Clostridia bacterium]